MSSHPGRWAGTAIPFADQQSSGLEHDALARGRSAGCKGDERPSNSKASSPRLASTASGRRPGSPMSAGRHARRVAHGRDPRFRREQGPLEGRARRALSTRGRNGAGRRRHDQGRPCQADSKARRRSGAACHPCAGGSIARLSLRRSRAHVSPVGTTFAVSTIKITLFSGARVQCMTPFGTTNP